MARLVNAFEQFFDSAGDPLVQGKLYFYESGSSSAAKDTFADSAETIANSNPVILNGDGRCPNVFGNGSYRVILTDKDDVQIVQRDPVGGDIGITFGADWNSTQIYSENDVVLDDGVYWISIVSNNQNNKPSTDGGANWRIWPDGQDLSNGSITNEKLATPLAKNMIINGLCQVARRPTDSIGNTYKFGSVERFQVKADGTVGGGTINQATSLVGSVGNFALKADSVTLTGTTAVYARTRIEARDAEQYANQTCCFSVKVKHDVASAINYVITINKATTEDNFASVDLIATDTISVNQNVLTDITLSTAMGDCSNGVEIIVKADTVSSITNKNFFWTEWQFNYGTTRTKLDTESYSSIVSKCDRFLEVISGASVANQGVASGMIATDTRGYFVIPYKTTKRTSSVTVTVSAASDFGINYYNGTIFTSVVGNAFAEVQEGEYACTVYLEAATSVFASLKGDACYLKCENTNARLYIDAEFP